MLYDYKCEACKNYFEKHVKSPDELVPCPSCETYMHRLPSAPKLAYFRMGIDSSLGTAADKWARFHEKNGGISEESLDLERSNP